MTRSGQAWEAEMRASNKRANGSGWTIRQLKGRCQITMKLESGRKPSVLTEIPWQPDQSLTILNAVQEVRAFIEKGHSIQEANEMRLKVLGKASGKAPALREFDWVAAADDFLKSMKSRREGTLDDLRIRVRRFKLTLKSRPNPTGAISTSRWITPGRTPLLNGWKKLPTLGSAQTLSPARSASTSPVALAIRSNGDTPEPMTSSSRWIKKSPSRWARSCAASDTRRTSIKAAAKAGRNGGGDPQVPHVGAPHLRRAKPQQATAMRAKRLRSQLLFIKKI